MSIELVRGSVTDQGAEVIVNAANTLMRGGGGIDGRIHQLAGPKLLMELQRVAPRGAEVAQPVVTAGHNLPARWIIHIAGPIWRGGLSGEPDQLADCYRNALQKADELGAKSIAFCSISTGAFGFPLDRAAPIAVQTLKSAADQVKNVEQVILAMFGAEEYSVFQNVVN